MPQSAPKANKKTPFLNKAKMISHNKLTNQEMPVTCQQTQWSKANTLQC